jgi:hypothetical protein
LLVFRFGLIAHSPSFGINRRTRRRADRDPLSQQRHLQPAAAVGGKVGENPVEPLQKLEFRRFRPQPV